MAIKRNKKWLVKVSHSEKEGIVQAENLARELGMHTATAQLLINRGCDSVEAAAAFLTKNTEQLHDPFLMKDMERAAHKIINSVRDGKKIIVYGDYDVDGVTSVAILYMYLKEIGANVGYYIPSRLSEGYGMSEVSLSKLSDDGASLIITVDTGITAVEEAEIVKKLGMVLIITDHHECHDIIPCAYAVVNPKQKECNYPFKDLAGVGVVFKLLCAMEIINRPGDSNLDCIRSICDKYIDLVAIGTVADVMPLRDENRLIVSKGLYSIEKRPRMSIEQLILASSGESKPNAKRKITSGFVGFTIAPRVNAAGRIKDASVAVELFLSENKEEAGRLSRELCEINHLRQQEENAIIEQAYEKIEREHDFRHDPVIVLDHESWHHGIIGIVASRITERYGKPCILISFDETKEKGCDDNAPVVGKGSGRSIKGMNLVSALTHCSDLLEKYGGHELAAGLSITKENLDDFKQKINDFARGCFDGEGPVTCLEAEYEMLPEEVTMDQAIELYKLEPYGVSNPVPLFAMYSVSVTNISSVGQGKHSKLILSKDGLVVTAMCFRKSPDELDIITGDTVDILFNLDVNEFQNMKNLQLILKDIKLSDSILEKQQRDQKLFEEIHCGSFDFSVLTESEISELIPVRADFANVYNLIKRELRLGRETFTIRGLLSILEQNSVKMHYVKLKYIILIFQEMNILGVDKDENKDDVYKFSYVFVKTKADLDKSNILKKLRSASIQK